MTIKLENSTDLTGTILIAMPAMGDPRFERSVIYLCAHSSDGAMGLIVNKPTEQVNLQKLMNQLDINVDADLDEQPAYIGGPVEAGRGFVLHSADYRSAVNTVQVKTGFRMTATLDILEAIGSGNGPSKCLTALGYSGWGAGQLENEIARNAWLTCDATPELVFDTPDSQKWDEAMASLGINPLLLSSQAGHA
jgi:putative transcriptional regulator